MGEGDELALSELREVGGEEGLPAQEGMVANSNKAPARSDDAQFSFLIVFVVDEDGFNGEVLPVGRQVVLHPIHELGLVQLFLFLDLIPDSVHLNEPSSADWVSRLAREEAFNCLSEPAFGGVLGHEDEYFGGSAQHLFDGDSLLVDSDGDDLLVEGDLHGLYPFILVELYDFKVAGVADYHNLGLAREFDLFDLEGVLDEVLGLNWEGLQGEVVQTVQSHYVQTPYRYYVPVSQLERQILCLQLAHCHRIYVLLHRQLHRFFLVSNPQTQHFSLEKPIDLPVPSHAPALLPLPFLLILQPFEHFWGVLMGLHYERGDYMLFILLVNFWRLQHFVRNHGGRRTEGRNDLFRVVVGGFRDY